MLGSKQKIIDRNGTSVREFRKAHGQEFCGSEDLVAVTATAANRIFVINSKY